MGALKRRCEKCGDVIKASNQRHSESTLCRGCYDTQGDEGKQRVCIDCGDVKECLTLRDASALRCSDCSRIEVGKQRIGTTTKTPKKLYWYFCANCPKIQVKKTKQGGRFCITCNRKQPRRKNRLKEIYFDMKTMMYIVPIRHIRICPHCPKDDNTKDVRVAKLAGIRPCRKHAYTDNPEALAEKEAKRVITRESNKANHKKVYKKKRVRVKAPPSSEAIAKARKINQEHREAQMEIVVIPQRESEEDMIAKFLKTKQPSVVFKEG